MELVTKSKRAKGDVCCEPVVLPDIGVRDAGRLATIAKALADPIRIQLLDVLRAHAGKVCVCELVALFDVSQPTVSHHLRVLRDAQLIASEKRGLWVYYYVLPGGLDGLADWLR
ncbi:MAG TPA: metalloregulator ArsR/SmtB family transcription factor [Solirubrobacteraceae bacterium]|jgi:ArsR family transcriptional regulator|nr:metalloregulator ArsR/SmtB family transcription factor [Solirubrobacteraceae bacterium]